MPFTTGLITNTRATGTASSNIVVSSRNLGPNPATVVLQIFGVPSTTLVLTPIYVAGFVVPANSADIREFFIAGNVAYEVQINVVSVLTSVAMSTYGLDEFGNIVQEQRVLQSEFTPITSLSI